MKLTHFYKTSSTRQCRLIVLTFLSLAFPIQAQINKSGDEKSLRYKRGWEKLKEVDAEAGQKIINNLENISPDLATYIIEYSFGDIYSREGLDLKSKQLAVVSSLVAKGNARPQLKFHFGAALNTGNSINEIKEVILHMSVYSGFPSTINAMNTFHEVLKERQAAGIQDQLGVNNTNLSTDTRKKQGEKELTAISANQVQLLKDTYKDTPDLVNFILEYAYSDIYSRNVLNKKQRQIATIAALTSLGTAPDQLKFHINAGLNIGLTVKNIESTILMTTVFAGFPTAINAINSLNEVMQQRNLSKP